MWRCGWVGGGLGGEGVTQLSHCRAVSTVTWWMVRAVGPCVPSVATRVAAQELLEGRYHKMFRLTASITRAAGAKDSFAGQTCQRYTGLRWGGAVAASGGRVRGWRLGRRRKQLIALCFL